MKLSWYNLLDYASSEIHNPVSIRWFRMSIYVILLFQTLVMCLPVVDYIWGENSFINLVRYKGNWIHNFYMALHNPKLVGLYPYLLGMQLIGLGLGFFKRFTRIASILVYIATVILFNRVYLIITGGNYLIHIFLFYLMFINENGKKSGVNAILSNSFFWACRIQVIFVYFFASIYKLTGDTWLTGEALHYLMNMQEFSLPMIIGKLEGATWLLTFGTYLSLAYQLLFPVLVWFKKIKIPFLAIGVGFHVATIVLMGIPIFGMIMIASYIIFLSDDELASLFKSKVWRRAKA